jgi:2-keto-4-pentenoate hydratase/2-oxohepta-3-ene-1,7-dioic acid hydratase in catechol pathway
MTVGVGCVTPVRGAGQKERSKWWEGACRALSGEEIGRMVLRGGTKMVRYEKDNGAEYGVIDEDVVRRVNDPFAKCLEIGSAVGLLEELVLLAPCEPTNVVGMHGNNLDWYEDEESLPERPKFFLKSTSCIVGPGADVMYPEESVAVAAEAEIAVVIAEKTRSVSVAEASEHILGFTCANDVTAVDVWERDEFAAKSFETFLPLGPVIAYPEEPIQFSCEIDGEVAQRSALDRLVFRPEELVSAASRVFTLRPGDIILCGAARGAELTVKRGSIMTVEVEGVGRLTNRLV